MSIPTRPDRGTADEIVIEVDPTAVSGRQATPGTDPVMRVTRLGRYVVLHKLGEGGMGVVHKGYDPGLDRRVALKLLRRHVDTRGWLLREGQALARLAHPHVVGIYEVGEHEGHVYLAMELVEGPTLRKWLEEQRRPFHEILRLFIQAGRGLAAAHDAGLVHRDFKPENVLIGRDGRARVGDFGIAGLAGEPPPPRAERGPTETPTAVSMLASPLTGTGILGTPAFMSPEHFRGERVTPLSDQWDFCVALYRAAYRTAPFAGEDVSTLRDNVLRADPTPPPFLPEAPLWLAPIVLRGLARDPAGRFGSMTELLDALESHLPRDPDSDPQIVIRERGSLSALFVILITAYASTFLTSYGTQLLTSRKGLIVAPAAMLAILSGTVALRWPRLSRNRYGRRLAVLFPGCSFVILLNHLVARLLHMSVAQIVAEDLMVMATFYGVVAIMEDRWIGWLAALAATASLLAGVDPERAGLVIGIVGLMNVVAMFVRLTVDRYMSVAFESPAETTPRAR